MVEMIFIFGLATGFVIGIIIGASLGNNSNQSTYSHTPNRSDDRVRRYMNNPIVEELNEQAQSKNLP